MLKKIQKKIQEDNGNAVIVLGLMLIIATLLVGGMLLDVTKAHQMKNSYIDSARKATQTAIRHQNTEGYLIAEAAGEAFYFYEKLARPDIISDGYMSSCDDTRNIELSIYFMDENFERGSHVATIDSSQINNSDNYRSVTTKMRVNGQPLTPAIRAQIQNERYTGVEMELTESTPNVILPGATTLTGLDSENVRCQRIGVKAGASQLLGDMSGEYN